jgi:hypothetical protein
MQICAAQRPPLFGVGDKHASRCWLQHEDASRTAPRVYIPPRSGRTPQAAT